MIGGWVLNEAIYHNTNQEYVMKLQFSDCKLNHSSENQSHLYWQKDTNHKVILRSIVLALQVLFTAKFIVIPQHLKIL